MPNHCHNRVSFYSDDSTAILKLHKIWSSGLENNDDSETRQTVFGHFIPEPDWSKHHLKKMRSKNTRGINLRVKLVNYQFIRIRDSVKDSISPRQILMMIGGIIGGVRTGELNGIATH